MSLPYYQKLQKKPSNMGHAHIARPSPTSCDAFVKDSVKRSVFLCSKKISSALRLNSVNHGARASSD
jgi:hypothetical protein